MSHSQNDKSQFFSAEYPTFAAIIAFILAGVGFYAAKRIPYAHFVWHLFVLAGTTCHFIAVLKYAG